MPNLICPVLTDRCFFLHFYQNPKPDSCCQWMIGNETLSCALPDDAHGNDLQNIKTHQSALSHL